MSRASLPPEYFERLYEADPDPWRFETSDYEREKYARTLAALPSRKIERIFEIGCSIGVLTRELSARCESLLAADVADAALEQARARCGDLPGVAFARMRVPGEWPDQAFDLILFSEVLYYLSPDDIRAVASKTLRSLAPGGAALLVHFTGETDYPCTADEAVEIFKQATTPVLTLDLETRHPQYRLDRLVRG